MKAVLLIAAGVATFAVAVAPAAGGRPQVSAFLTDARAGYGHLSSQSLSRNTFVTDARMGYGAKAGRATGYDFVTDSRGGYGGNQVLGAETNTAPAGFDWADAGAGAGVATLIMVLLGGGILITLHKSNRVALRR